jgi:hypothetical protein
VRFVSLNDHVAVDDLGHIRGLVADRAADVLDRDAAAAHDRDRGVAAFVGVPVTDTGLRGHLGEAAVEASDVYGAPFSWQKTRLLGCQASPASRRSASCPTLCALRAVMARFGRMSERLDFGVLVSPILLALRQTWTTPPLTSTCPHVSLRSSPGRSPSVMARTKSASSRRLALSVSSMPSCAA